MTNLFDSFASDHSACDAIFARCEAALGEKDGAAAAQHFDAFLNALQDHFAAEEEIMFPAFETQTGMTSGPTAVMRSEHAQMRSICSLITPAIAENDLTKAAKLIDTLFSLLQSHNMKEEQILYPMCATTLSYDTATVASAIARLSASKAAP